MAFYFNSVEHQKIFLYSIADRRRCLEINLIDYTQDVAGTLATLHPSPSDEFLLVFLIGYEFFKLKSDILLGNFLTALALKEYDFGNYNKENIEVILKQRDKIQEKIRSKGDSGLDLYVLLQKTKIENEAVEAYFAIIEHVFKNCNYQDPGACTKIKNTYTNVKVKKPSTGCSIL